MPGLNPIIGKDVWMGYRDLSKYPDRNSISQLNFNECSDLHASNLDFIYSTPIVSNSSSTVNLSVPVDKLSSSIALQRPSESSSTYTFFFYCR